ncbi:uncharacterized protein ATNIH1004_000003 [Aspergillus tanneri]|uniref:Uncharacterized protein n=1 Tax=Aspergillus tanneri TaxID=1220188 RepID=A0A5M9MVL1_9EURO|nr:uncharacterized protein ATNIH1004_000003 [Aspergillus tanneri]KAA8651125.1 hypothetical protein ATNIH1004_000003 [Aspergillus tanneri]
MGCYVAEITPAIFPSRKGSHYIYVRGSEEEPSIPVHTEQVDQAIQQITEALGGDEDPDRCDRGWRDPRRQPVVADDGVDPVFTGVYHAQRLRRIGVQRIWKAMEGVVRKSQWTVQHTGQAIRIEAVRSEKGQTPYRPLQVYMDADSVAKHVQPWQQILAFIARTQAPHPEKRPPYGMTPRQRKKWRQLWQMASQISSPNSIDEADSTDERDPERAQWMMSDIERACLECCIKLMNQTYHAQEYESVLICAMAVLGRGEFGWQDAESYPPILSRVIKIARFMIVQKALWLDPDVMQIIETWQKPQNCAEWTLRSAAAVDNIETNSVYGSEVEGPPSSPPTSPMRSGDPQSRINISQRDPSRKTFQEQVTWMVSQLMVRGTHIPMETLQDWRTYGLKIYYNTTAPGHVTWMQPDRLLYKHLQFTMGDFRGLRPSSHGTRCTTIPPKAPWDGAFARSANIMAGRRPQWIMERIRTEPDMQYLQRVARFKEKLAVLVHVVGGQPGRAPELLSLQHVNTETNQRRNVFIKDGMVTLVSAYHKGFYASNDVKVVSRYIPREVGELIIWYLWLVLPFAQQLEVWYQRRLDESSIPHRYPQHRPFPHRHPQRRPFPTGIHSTVRAPTGIHSTVRAPPASTSPSIWGPDPGTQRAWTSERFREVLKRETKMRLHYAVNIQAYREIAIGISWW